MVIKIYTDGSSRGNGTDHARSGYGYVAVLGDEEVQRFSKQTKGMTNQEAELQAAVAGATFGLMTLSKGVSRVEIYTDSAYIVNCYKDKWYVNWEKNGWKNARKNPVANKSLWKKLIPFFRNESFDFIKVEGHAGDKWNTIADKLATGELSSSI